MKPLLRSIACAIALLAISCGNQDPNAQVDEGNVSDNVYTSEAIGWSIIIPKGWEVVSKDEMEETTEKGKEAMEGVAGEVDFSGMKHLISFRKNDFNIFQSTSEPFKEEYEGEWMENNAAIRDLIYMTYSSRGIKVDTSSTKASIDGLEFNVFRATIFNDEGEVLLNQEMYSRLINGFDFGVNLNYNNEEYKATMLRAWEQSTFKKVGSDE
ncbi:MAG: hypothetical protein R3B47_19100 [Bacteroidia bacterium]